MADLYISKIKLPSGNTYILKDNDAYRKSETYTKAEVEAAIAEAIKGGYILADELPTASEDTLGHIYLIPGDDPAAGNAKNEYITVGLGTTPETYAWELIGSTEVDISNLGELAYKDTVTLNKGNGDNVLGEATTFTNSTSAVTFSGGTTDKVLGEATTFALSSGAVTHGTPTKDSVLGADTTFTVTQPTIALGGTTRYLSAAASGGGAA